jgi:hypothetical protein
VFNNNCSNLPITPIEEGTRDKKQQLRQLKHWNVHDTMSEDAIFTAKSRSKKKIRLIRATWLRKIVKDHPELGAREEYVNEVKRTIEDPDYIISCWFGEQLALRFCELAPHGPKYLCVVYRETNGKGFVITTFFTSRLHRLLRRGVLWQKRS